MKSSAAPLLCCLLAIALTGCNMPLTPLKASPTPTPTTEPTATLTPVPTEVPPTPTVTLTPSPAHKDKPGSPVGKQFQTVHDQVDKNTAPQKQAFGGDDFRNGKYERPFDQQMNYMPEIDLVTVLLNRADPLWVYVLIKVGQPLTGGQIGDVHFLVEIDTDKDVRGDLLIISGLPQSTEWSTDTVKVYTNPDRNVGGEQAVRPDGVLSEGRGYYAEIFNDGTGDDPDQAWSRLSKTDADTVEIAFKNTLTGGEKGEFIWLPWTDSGMLDWSLFDFNDHFTFSQAGYPLKDDMQNYPLKALWGVDNTCRLASGFEPDAKLIGLCPQYNPEKPEENPPEQCQWQCWGGLFMQCGCR